MRTFNDWHLLGKAQQANLFGGNTGNGKGKTGEVTPDPRTPVEPPPAPEEDA